ncbi:MAG: hypothetical protein LBK99_16270 [Opitutaceae bacterium]|jgi:hypothetical protein|nr:hypothetical protein [Opitutaceae bacterium]
MITVRTVSSFTIALFVAILARAATVKPADTDALGIPGVTLRDNGAFTVGGLGFTLAHYGKGWSYASLNQLQPSPGFPKHQAQPDPESWTLTGSIMPKQASASAHPLTVSETLTRIAGGLATQWRVTHPDGVPTNSLCVTITIPIVTGAAGPVVIEKKYNSSKTSSNSDSNSGSVSREEFHFPTSYNGTANLLDLTGVTRLTLPSPGGSLTLEPASGDSLRPLRVSLHDDRSFGGRSYSVRLYFSPRDGMIRDAALAFNITRFDIAPGAFPSATIQAGADWAPYDHLLDIHPGSIFDRSAATLADAPAGRYGHIKTNARGHFIFANAPDRRARFWGVNLCFDTQLMDREQTDRLADRLLRSGYNAVRFHHYDGLIVRKTPDGAAHEIDPEKLDRLEYLFAALKKRGLYITIDLYTVRRFTPQELPGSDIKLQMPVSPASPGDAAFRVWSHFARALLTHRNPHTGLAWAEDPALFGICMLNEDTFFFGGSSRLRKNPVLNALYEKAFAGWKTASAGAPEPVSGNDAATFNRFIVEIKKNSDARMMAFLREELGVRALLTSDNNMNTEAQVFVRDRFDFVDNHDYWNHPVFLGSAWSFPLAVNHHSAIISGLWLPRELMPSRVFGKPYTVTEFNYVWPNAARSEGGLLMAASAGLQDWDALFNFDYAAQAVDALVPGVPTAGGRVFSLATDPVGMLADRAAAFLFLHGGVRPAPTAVAWLADPVRSLDGERGNPARIPGRIGWLGFLVRTGSLPADAQNRSAIAAATGIRAFVGRESSDGPVYPIGNDIEKTLARANIVPVRPDQGVYRSETGQMEISTDLGTARLVTDFAECFVTPPRSRAAGRLVSIKNGETFASTYVLSADNRPIGESRRLLVLHLTDSLNTGTRFSDTDRKRLEHSGTLPHLVKRGATAIRLNFTGKAAASWRGWAIDASGKRLRALSLEPVNEKIPGAFLLNAETVTDAGTTFAYELVRESRCPVSGGGGGGGGGAGRGGAGWVIRRGIAVARCGRCP